jgi:hypothetical protein
MKTTKPRQPKKSSVRQKAYFFSDAHLGLGSTEEDRQKELRLIRSISLAIYSITGLNIKLSFQKDISDFLQSSRN